jgi:hypothetical protein
MPSAPCASTCTATTATASAWSYELPTYGYRRVHAILKRQALAAGGSTE